MSMITFSVKAGKKFYDIALSGKPTVKDLKLAFAKVARKDINRISLKAGEIRLDDDSKSLVDDYHLGKGGEITFKDLGPQIGYRTVFLGNIIKPISLIVIKKLYSYLHPVLFYLVCHIVEYLGPMLFVAFYAIRPAFVYGDKANATPYKLTAKVAIVCWIVHFMKRELETIFIHKFSRPTMPLSNLFKNCAYYWIFGAVIGYVRGKEFDTCCVVFYSLMCQCCPSRTLL